MCILNSLEESLFSFWFLEIMRQFVREKAKKLRIPLLFLFLNRTTNSVFQSPCPQPLPRDQRSSERLVVTLADDLSVVSTFSHEIPVALCLVYYTPPLNDVIRYTRIYDILSAPFFMTIGTIVPFYFSLGFYGTRVRIFYDLLLIVNYFRDKSCPKLLYLHVIFFTSFFEKND